MTPAERLGSFCAALANHKFGLDTENFYTYCEHPLNRSDIEAILRANADLVSFVHCIAEMDYGIRNAMRGTECEALKAQAQCLLSRLSVRP